MRIACNILVSSKLLSSLSISKQKKPVKSTLALCRHPKSKQFCIILFTAENKSGTKYDIKKNIRGVLTKFINEGKCTIQFKQPEHDLLISGDSRQLKYFMAMFKRVLEDKITEKDVSSLSSIAVTSLKASEIPVTKMSINSRSEYTSGGLPRSLITLKLNGIKLRIVDTNVLRLECLKILDLSDNAIEFIPEALNALHLYELNLSKNSLFKSKPSQWGWLGGQLKKYLQNLDLSQNALPMIPNQLCTLSLKSLNVSSNVLTKLPLNIGKMKDLKNLYAADNRLEMLPGSLVKLRMKAIDVSRNLFYREPLPVEEPVIKKFPMCTLKECASKTTLNANIPYPVGSIPKTLIDYLDNAKYCSCGRACINVHVRELRSLRLSNIADSVNTGARETMYAPMEFFYCSTSCRIDFRPPIDNRYPIVR